MEWFALLIPLGISLYVWKIAPRQVLWWELLLPLLVGAILIAVSRPLAIFIHTRHEEYWTGYATRSEYYEQWVERVEHDEDITDKDGKVIGHRHWTTYDTHPAEYYINDNNGIRLSVDSSVYETMCQRWRNRRYESVFHMNASQDGGMYYTDWPGDDSTMEVVSTIHYYENRIPVSNSPYRYAEIPQDQVKRFQLIEHPRVSGYDTPMILGPSVPGKALAERELGIVNAKLGHRKEVRIWVILFKNQSEEAALKQKAYWQGGNMNEFNLCIGVDSTNNIQWAYAFSWMKDQALTVAARHHVADIAGQSLDLREVVSWLGQNVDAQWQRRDFTEFNYLQVEIPGWAIFCIYLLVTGAAAGCAYWAVNNGYDEDGSPKPFRQLIRIRRKFNRGY